MSKDQMTAKLCPRCGQTDANYIAADGYCWEEESCHSRTYPPSWAMDDDDRMCLTSDNEQMYVALRKIMAITGHDHSNPIFEICIESLPSR